MYLFDIDFKNVYKKVDHMLISMYVINWKKDRYASNWIIMYHISLYSYNFVQ